jgi:cell division protein FtsQ
VPTGASTPAGKRRNAARKKRTAKGLGGAKRKPAVRKPRKTPARRSPHARRAPEKTRAKRAPARAGRKPRARSHGGRAAPPKARRAAARSRRNPLRHLRRPSLRSALIVLPLLLAALAAGYFAWFRDSSLVAVREVKVTGLESGDEARIAAALSGAAEGMTTLHVDDEALAASVEGFPTVVGVQADASFPHGLQIEVTERPPVLVAEAGGERVPVAADGTLLRGVELGEDAERLPELALGELPARATLEGEGLEQALVAGAAPEPLRPLIEGIALSGEHGVEITLEGDIPVRFGTSVRARAKWAAAAAILADPKLKTLTYLDVRVPERPAVGGAAPATEEASTPAEGVSTPIEEASTQTPDFP